MTNPMLSLKTGVPNLEIREHHTIVFHMKEAVQDGVTSLVKANIGLFVRVISVSKIQAAM